MSGTLYFEDSRCIKLCDNTNFYYYNTDKYKRSELDIFFTLPLDRYKTPLIKLMIAVLFRGCESMPSLTDISKKLDFLYDSSLYSNDYQIGTNYVNRVRVRVLDKKYLPERDRDLDLIGEVISIVEDILLRPLKGENGLLCERFINAEREFAIDGINSRRSSPKSYAAIRCSEMLFADRTEGIPLDGSEELLRGYTAAEVTDAWEFFLRNSHITAYYIGSDDAARVADKLCTSFSKIKDRTPMSPAKKNVLTPVPYAEECEEFELSQAILRLGLTSGTAIGEPDCPAWLVYNEILGGSSTSKLFMNVREKRSLCYYCHSLLDVCTGAMGISCGIKPENHEQALSEIKNQLDEMRLGVITEEELSFAKKGIINSLTQLPDSTSYLPFSDFRYRILTDAPESIGQRIRDIESVSIDDVVRVAKKVELCSVFFLTARDGEILEEYGEDEDEQDD